jgi:hypothetical protein
MQGGYWPNVQLVADKCAGLAEDEATGRDLSSYLAGQSPSKKQQSFENSFNNRIETPIKPFGAQEAASLRQQTPQK